MLLASLTEYQQMVQTLQSASEEIPVAVFQIHLDYKEMGEREAKEKWWVDKAKLIRDYLATTGRLVGEAEGNEWSQFEVK